LDNTILFLRFFASFTLIIGFAMIINKDNRSAIISLENNHPIILGMITLLIGLPIVLLHNIWIGTLPIIVTFFGWLTVLKGCLRILNLSSKIKSKISYSNNQLIIQSWIAFLLGIFLFSLSFLNLS